jgi:hypothetical protein
MCQANLTWCHHISSVASHSSSVPFRDHMTMPPVSHVSNLCQPSSSELFLAVSVVIVVTAIHPIARAGSMSGRYRFSALCPPSRPHQTFVSGRPAWVTHRSLVVNATPSAGSKMRGASTHVSCCTLIQAVFHWQHVNTAWCRSHAS